MESGNPVLSFVEWGVPTLERHKKNVMGVKGTANKTIILFTIVVLAASCVWATGIWISSAFQLFFWPGTIGILIIVFITILRKEWARITSPIYAVLMGFFLGGVSSFFESLYPGIVLQAVALTFSVFFCMLCAYRLGLIKVTRSFVFGVVTAMSAIFLIYFITLIGFLVGFRVPFIHESGPIGIGFSSFAVCVASLTLVLDLNLIDDLVKSEAPKHMEWYCAFGLLVTLVWLYVEILNLLAKIRKR